MEEMTISEVSRRYQISARMLRHYEKLGMIESRRRQDYAYRIYDGEAVRRVGQIIILRKLQIPLKKIRQMLDGDRQEAIQILEEQIREVSESAASVQRTGDALEKLLALLQREIFVGNYLDTLSEEELLKMTELLPLEKHHLKEERAMEQKKETDRMQEMIKKADNVRYVWLPPYTVAAYQYVGENPEEHAGNMISRFVQESGLYERKPDARMFGFNHPDPEEGKEIYGYEVWVTIPEDMEVPAPLVKRDFPGGLYAAYTIKFPDFHEWQFLTEWVKQNECYQEDFGDSAEKNMGGCLEEHLNWVYAAHMGWPENGIDGKLDLLLPIRPR